MFQSKPFLFTTAIAAGLLCAAVEIHAQAVGAPADEGFDPAPVADERLRQQQLQQLHGRRDRSPVDFGNYYDRQRFRAELYRPYYHDAWRYRYDHPHHVHRDGVHWRHDYIPYRHGYRPFGF